MAEQRRIFTVGHSNRGIDDLLGLLRRHGVALLVDVRSRPFSRFGHFSRQPLERSVTEAGMTYRFLGDALGGKPDREAHPDLYDAEGHVRYERVAAQPGFREGIARLLEAAAEKPTAILCAEEDPTRCHRWRLVGAALREQGVDVLHIRGDGRVEDESALAAGQKAQLDLF